MCVLNISCACMFKLVVVVEVEVVIEVVGMMNRN